MKICRWADLLLLFHLSFQVLCKNWKNCEVGAFVFRWSSAIVLQVNSPHSRHIRRKASLCCNAATGIDLERPAGWNRGIRLSDSVDFFFCTDAKFCKLYGLHLHLRKMQTQCEPDYLQMWSGRSDHSLTLMHLHLALTCVFPYLDNLSGYRLHFNVRCKWVVIFRNLPNTGLKH